MQSADLSHEQILRMAQFSAEDLAEINLRRRPHNRLGFAYQMAFVRLYNRFPAQQPLEITDEVLTFVGLQLALATEGIEVYQQRRETVAEQQQKLREYLGLRRIGEVETAALEKFLFVEACHLEQTGPLLAKTKEHLRELGILQPANDTLRQLIVRQREQARLYIFIRISDDLTPEVKDKLEALLLVDEAPFSPLQVLKQPPGQASPAASLRLIEKLKQVEATGILTVNLSWLNNNYQRALTHCVRRCSAARLRQLQPPRRYAVLVCFLWQTYRDTIDYISAQLFQPSGPRDSGSAVGGDRRLVEW